MHAPHSLDDPASRLRRSELPASRVLIVEDDIDLKDVVVRLVGKLDPAIGVDWAPDYDEAVAQMQRHDYQLILADYFLKGSRTGLSLLERRNERQPDAVFALMSSMSFEGLLELSSRHDLPTLRKPFTAADCLGLLGAALA